MPELIPYDRQAAVRYAHQWAFSRNPRYFDFETIGGDCTNFASQCLYQGSGVMNFTPDFGWYYIDAGHKAPAWTGVPYFYNFMTRQEASQGPVGVAASPDMLLPGDFVQLRFAYDTFGHTPIIVEVGDPPTLDNILVAAHSQDADFRPLSTYYFQEIRFLHILGTRPPAAGSPAESAARLPFEPGGLSRGPSLHPKKKSGIVGPETSRVRADAGK